MDRLKIFAMSLIFLLLAGVMTLTFIGTVSQESHLYPIETQIKVKRLLLPVIQSKDNLTDEEILAYEQELSPFIQKDFPLVKDILSVEKKERKFLELTVVFQDKEVRTIAYPLKDVLENVPKLNETYQKKCCSQGKTTKEHRERHREIRETKTSN